MRFEISALHCYFLRYQDFKTSKNRVTFWNFNSFVCIQAVSTAGRNGFQQQAVKSRREIALA